MSPRVFRPHRPGRPHWRCTACGAPYPCGPARLALLHDYREDRLSLAVLLGLMLQDAMNDLYTLGHRPDPAALHDRYLGWLALGGNDPTGPDRRP